MQDAESQREAPETETSHETIWELYPKIAKQVRSDHERVNLVGAHDFVHAFRVGEIARRVALGEWGDERLSHLAGLAGVAHNADRVIQKEKKIGRRDVPRDEVIALVTTWVQDALGTDEMKTVIEAVLGHDGRNSANDSEVLVALMDGDRIVNLDVDLFLRSGQYYHDLPAVDYRHLLDDPEATYRNPKSALRDAFYSLDWADSNSPVCVRTKLGKKMAETRAALFRTFLEALKEQFVEEGIHPFKL